MSFCVGNLPTMSAKLIKWSEDPTPAHPSVWHEPLFMFTSREGLEVMHWGYGHINVNVVMTHGEESDVIFNTTQNINFHSWKPNKSMTDVIAV